MEPISDLVLPSPNSNKLSRQACCALVRTRLGKQERSLLLAATPETWTAIPGWRTERHRLSVISRAINKLVNLKLIERHWESGWTPWNERDDSNSVLATRRDKSGYEDTTYRINFPIQSFKLTPLGAAVVQQFHNELTAGKRIRWSRFNPPPEPPPPPEPLKLTPEQEELQELRKDVSMTCTLRDWLLRDIEKARSLAEELPHLEHQLEQGRKSQEDDERRIAELVAAGVTLPDPEPDEIDGEENTTASIRNNLRRALLRTSSQENES